MPLEAVFYYNSSYADTNYGYGRGWTLGYEYRYTSDSSGVTIMTGDGRKDTYTGNTGGSPVTYTAPAGVFHTLTADSNGYTLRTKEGVQYIFADTLSKCVTQIRDRNNNTLHFAYTNGRLDSISDDNGRSIILTWTDSLLTSLRANVGDRTWHYAYDTLGNLVSVTNPMNYTVHYGYDKSNRINRFTDEAGYNTLISYTDEGRVHRVKTDLTDKSIRYDQSSNQTVIIDYMGADSLLPAEVLGHNQFSTYRWDNRGRVIEKTGNCCGYTSKLAYDNDNNIIRREDANGNVTTYTYDANGNMLSMTDPMGNTERFTYEPLYNNPASYTDQLGHQYTFSYDSQGNPTTVNGPLGSSIQLTHDAYGQMTSNTDALGGVTTYTYDQYGNMVSSTNALGNTSSFQYNAYGEKTTTTSPMGASMQVFYDKLGQVTSYLNPLGNRTSLTRDNRGNITDIVNAMQQRMSVSYDALNRPDTLMDAKQGIRTLVYNAHDKPILAEDPLHHIVRMQYNDRDQIIIAVDALGDSTHYEYDAIGNLIMVTLPNGRHMVYTYDANSRPVQFSDQYGMIQKTIYDAMGRTIATINANGDTTHMTYDALGRLTQSTDPLGHTEQYSYDLAGNMLTHTDANGNTTTYSYDAIGNLLSETDAMNNVTTYTYNADGELTSVTDANGNATNYQYDAANQLTLITFANGKTQQFWYDAAGNVIRHKDETGNQTVMTYDAIGNLISRTYPDGSSDQYTYNLNGNLLTADNANANLTFTYDANGQVLSETMSTTFNSQLSIINYEYNQRNGHIQITYHSGRIIEEHYDLRGRISTILNSQSSILNSPDTIASFTYTPTNYVATRTYGNGDHTTFSYDAANRLTKITSLNSQFSILNYNYTYDPAGNILSRIDSLRPNRSEIYGYDALHRLTSFKRGQVNNSGIIPNPLKQVQYTLDALGNRISVTSNGTTTSYSHNNMNTYTNVGGQTILYDNNGNMLGDGNHTYQYNYRNRMVSVDNSSTATYQYDALDRRIRKTTATDTIQYYYRGVQCIEELHTNIPSREEASSNIPSGGGQGWVSYIYGTFIDDILSMHHNDQDYFYHNNHLGSVMTITDISGAIVETYDYDPYSAPTIYDTSNSETSTSIVGNTILFTGREYDFESSHYFYRARMLHPTFGFFMQHDPLLYVNDYNLYSYVRNKPITRTDPLGYYICSINGCSKVSDNTIIIVEEMEKLIEKDNLEVTSAYRSIDDQMDIMYDKSEIDLQGQYNLYGNKGDKVLNEYEQGKKENKTKEEIIEDMKNKAFEVGFASKHNDEDNPAIDLGFNTNNLTEEDIKKLGDLNGKTIKGCKVRIIIENNNNNNCVHIEVYDCKKDDCKK
jgi:RHS repeat-associated protein